MSVDISPNRSMLRDDLLGLMTRVLGTDSKGRFLRSPEQMMSDIGHLDVFRRIAHHIDVMDPQEFCDEVSWQHPAVLARLTNLADKLSHW